MKVHELPWWNSSVHNKGFWRLISHEEFSHDLSAFPPSTELIDDFYRNYVSCFRLVPLKGGCGYILPRDKRNRSEDTLNICFTVTIDRNQSLDIQVETLIHEGLHGIYRVGVNPQENHQFIFDTSKELAKKHHLKYKEFLERTYTEYNYSRIIEINQF